MTENIRICYENRADDATLTATSAALAVANLQDMQQQVVWSSTSAAAQTITIPLSVSRSINCVGLMNHNLSSDATIRVQGASDAGFTSVLFDTTYDALDPSFGWGEFPWGMVGWGGYSSEGWEYQFTVKWITLTVARYWRLIITDTTNADGYVQAGRLILGQYWTPHANMQWGYSLDWHDPSEVVRTRGGSWRSDNKTPYRVSSVHVRWLDVVEAAGVLEMERQRGRRGDVLLSAYPNEGTTRERRNTLLGVLRDWSPSTHDFYGYNSVSFSIEESV